MMKLVDWLVPLIVSFFLIQVVSEALYARAMWLQPAQAGDDQSVRRGQLPQGPVHEIEVEARAGSIVT